MDSSNTRRSVKRKRTVKFLGKKGTVSRTLIRKAVKATSRKAS